ncbi:MAG: hypothetical protein WDN10_04115 [bacterium]
MHLRTGAFPLLLLRYTYVAFLSVMSIDKLLHFNVVDAWERFAGPVVHAILPVSTVAIVSIEGVVEIAIIALLLTRWYRIGALVLFLAIIPVWIDLMILGFYDLALHDLVVSAGAIALVLLPPPEEKPPLVQAA